MFEKNIELAIPHNVPYLTSREALTMFCPVVKHAISG